MTDFILGTTSLAVLAAAMATAVLMRALGVASTYVRDMLHVGAGVWVLAWPWWHSATIPIAIVVVVMIGTAIIPALARHVRLADRVQRSVTGGDEHWGGLVLYTVSYAIFTTLGLLGDPFAAAAALLALSLGDGIGGAVGRALGDHHFRAPGGKRKSFEGSVVVAIGAIAGALIAAALFGVSLGFVAVVFLGIVAAVTEALSPRGTDNLFVPVFVYIAAQLV